MSSSPERAIDGFIAKYTPGMQADIRTARARLQSIVTHGHELVYDNYNALVFGFSPTTRTSQAMLSLAAYPKWLTLFFLHGSTLSDRYGLLTGDGKQVRGIRLRAPEQLDEAGVRALIAQALAPHAQEFAAAPRLLTVVKSISAKQRPRRPATTAGSS